MTIEIDSGSGFCFGVTTAIRKAEEELAKGNKLYCLGDIVHNGMECERLAQLGLITINHEEMEQLHEVKVLLRAHGEPPETYELARKNGIEIIDATCPVVLQLQRRIKKQYEAPLPSPSKGEAPQIVIFGKPGHAEVIGLAGQTQNRAIVIANFEDVKRLDFTRDIYLYSQTTKSLDEFHRIIKYIQQHIAPGCISRVSTPSAVKWPTACPISALLLHATIWCSLSVDERAVMGVCYSESVSASILTATS